MDYAVGLDVAKETHRCAIVHVPTGNIKANFEINNNQAGFKKLREMFSMLDSDKTVIGLEATGHYHRNIISFINKHRYDIRLFNPLQVTRYRQSLLKRAKTDKLDAITIANLVAQDDQRKYVEASLEMKKLTELTRANSQIKHQASDIKRKLTGILDQTFPEFSKVFKDKFCKSALLLLKLFPTPNDIVRTSKKKYSRQPGSAQSNG